MEAPELLEQLKARPGGAELLELAPRGAFLVGGAVRDLLLGRTPRELDVVLAGEDASAGEGALAGEDAFAGEGALAGEDAFAGEGAPAGEDAFAGEDAPAGEVALLADALAARLDALAGSSEYERFGTASVEWPSGRIDIAAARRERYAVPGALPEVERAPLAEDLLRRDFTVNALALALGGARPGRLRAAPEALEDLRAGRLRVLHERSFRDDPTRLLRLARYRVRLDFAIEERTAELAAAALAGGALGTVSGARIGAELRLALREPDPLAALAELERLGVLAALHPRLRFEPAVVRRALALLSGDGGDRESADLDSGDRSSADREGVDRDNADRQGADRSSADRDHPNGDRADLLMLAALVLALTLRVDGDRSEHGRRAEVTALLDRFEFPAGDRDRVASAGVAVPRLLDELPAARHPSQLRAVARRVPAEGVALAGALSERARPAARRWLGELRQVRLRIDGGDLLAAGIAEGPDLGRRLEETLRMRLDGELPDERAAQLRAALELR